MPAQARYFRKGDQGTPSTQGISEQRTGGWERNQSYVRRWGRGFQVEGTTNAKGSGRKEFAYSRISEKGEGAGVPVGVGVGQRGRGTWERQVARES